MALAFFDMDKTLLSKSSGVQYVRYLWGRREISLREMLATGWISAQYSLNILDFPKAISQLGRYVRDGDAAATQALCDRFVVNELLQYLAPRALVRLREHQAHGDQVWLLSASTQFVVQPVAAHLGVRCGFTELEIIDGRFSGRIVGDSCYGEGKRIWGQRIAAQQDVPLANVTFYSDSYSDKPLLDAVGHPVAVNPDRRLHAYALEQGWPIEMFY